MRDNTSKLLIWTRVLVSSKTFSNKYRLWPRLLTTSKAWNRKSSAKGVGRLVGPSVSNQVDTSSVLDTLGAKSESLGKNEEQLTNASNFTSKGRKEGNWLSETAANGPFKVRLLWTSFSKMGAATSKSDTDKPASKVPSYSDEPMVPEKDHTLKHKNAHQFSDELQSL